MNLAHFIDHGVHCIDFLMGIVIGLHMTILLMSVIKDWSFRYNVILFGPTSFELIIMINC